MIALATFAVALATLVVIWVYSCKQVSAARQSDQRLVDVKGLLADLKESTRTLLAFQAAVQERAANVALATLEVAVTFATREIEGLFPLGRDTDEIQAQVKRIDLDAPLDLVGKAGIDLGLQFLELAERVRYLRSDIVDAQLPAGVIPEVTIVYSGTSELAWTLKRMQTLLTERRETSHS